MYGARLCPASAAFRPLKMSKRHHQRECSEMNRLIDYIYLYMIVHVETLVAILVRALVFVNDH